MIQFCAAFERNVKQPTLIAEHLLQAQVGVEHRVHLFVLAITAAWKTEITFAAEIQAAVQPVHEEIIFAVLPNVLQLEANLVAVSSIRSVAQNESLLACQE